MVKGLDVFRERLREFEDSFTLIAKHRNDVFRLAGTLPGEAGPSLPVSITDDLTRFLDSFPETSEAWPQILASLENTLGGRFRPATLRSAIQTYFGIKKDES